MSKCKSTFIVLCMTTLIGTTSLNAEDQVSVGASADVLSKYVWRGQDLVDDWVLQPGAYISYKNFTASFWGNLDMTDENGYQGEFSEIDLTLDYTAQVPGIDLLSYSLGFINYEFPASGADDTWELYWGFGLDVPASPTVTVYHDVDEVDGTYVSFGVSHSIENLAESGLGLDLGATLGWGSSNYNKVYWGPSKSELNDLVLSAALPFEIAGISVTPSVNYITLMGDKIRQPNAYGNNDMWVFGVGFSKDF